MESLNDQEKLKTKIRLLKNKRSGKSRPVNMGLNVSKGKTKELSKFIKSDAIEKTLRSYGAYTPEMEDLVNREIEKMGCNDIYQVNQLIKAIVKQNKENGEIPAASENQKNLENLENKPNQKNSENGKKSVKTPKTVWLN